MTKKGSLEQWQELGALSKEIHHNLVDLCVKADQIMPGNDWREAGKAQTAMLRFQSHAENVMFKQIRAQGGATVHFFFGDTAEHYVK